MGGLDIYDVDISSKSASHACEAGARNPACLCLKAR
jgi:hypothetical protein